MTEEHPTPEEGIVSRTVCFEWDSRSCSSLQPINIQAAACYDEEGGIFYIYEFKPTRSCDYAYCGLDGMGDSSGFIINRYLK